MKPEQGAAANRFLSGLVGIVLGTSFIAVLVLLGTAYLLFLPAASVRDTAYSSDDGGWEYEVRRGQGLRAVSRILAARGLVRSALAFEAYGRIRGYAEHLKAGRYLLSPTMTPAEILERIASGDGIPDERIVTVREGWSSRKIGGYLEAEGFPSAERFHRAAVMRPSYRDFTFLSDLPDGTPLEGYLFPDTYRVAPDSAPESLVRTMLDTFDRRLVSELRREISDQGRTLREAIILASIIQAEAGSVGEMRDISGVFMKRLEQRIPLESDATVNYALGTSRRQPTFVDIRTDHPYNTYRYRGLPPGPIGNPGMEAILAAVYPAENPFFFFLHKTNGEIVLSRTFREHLENKARFLD